VDIFFAARQSMDKSKTGDNLSYFCRVLRHFVCNWSVIVFIDVGLDYTFDDKCGLPIALYSIKLDKKIERRTKSNIFQATSWRRVGI
jgi:hypothetical protein